MKDYLLTIQIQIKSIDDPNARMEMKSILGTIPSCYTENLKLQEIFPDKPPRKVQL